MRRAPSPPRPPERVAHCGTAGARRCRIVVAQLLDVPAAAVVATVYAGGYLVSVQADLMEVSPGHLNEAIAYLRAETDHGRSVLAQAGEEGEAVIVFEVDQTNCDASQRKKTAHGWCSSTAPAR